MKPFIALLLIGCVGPATGGGAASADASIEPSPTDDTDTTPTDTDWLQTTDGFVDIGWFDVVDMTAPREEWCWTGIQLTVELQYWENFARYGASEDATQYCDPIEWTAVYDGACIRVQTTCPDDPRDPAFLDCSLIPECCGLGPRLGGCGI